MPPIKTGADGPEIPVSFASIADLLGVLELSEFALNVAFFVRYEYLFHPKSGYFQEVSRESVHIYRAPGFSSRAVSVTGDMATGVWRQQQVLLLIRFDKLGAGHLKYCPFLALNGQLK